MKPESTASTLPCKHKNSYGDYCVECGGQVRKKCPSCNGRIYIETDKFCSGCGLPAAKGGPR